MESASLLPMLPWELDIHTLYANKEAWQEGVHLEFKKSQSKLSEDLWETYSAFANTEGGIIILGVKDNGTILGVENVPQQKTNLTTSLNDPRKVSYNVSAAPGMIQSMELEGKQIIVFRVPKAATSQKPVYLNRDTAKAYFRQNESDILCTETMLQQMLRDKSDESPLSRLVPYTSFADIDTETWRQYRTLMKFSRPNSAWIRMEDLTLLEKLGGYTRNRETGQEGLTYAGLLMFGTDDAIRKHFPRYQINYYSYDGSERMSTLRRWNDRIYPDGSWEPNLFQFFYRVLPLISAPLRTPFKLNADMTTAQGESSAHVAVREALANAIVHADYFGDGGIDVRKYPSKLELSNPGTLLVPKNLIYKGGLSRCRNVALQSMFQNIGVVDKAGSGVDKILTGWLDQCLMPPSVEEETQGISRVIWTLPYVGLLPKSHEAELLRQFGERRYDSLDVVRRSILMIVLDRGTTAHKDIHQLLPFIHPVDLTRLLAGLVQAGFLQSEGRSSATRFSIKGESSIAIELDSASMEVVNARCNESYNTDYQSNKDISGVDASKLPQTIDVEKSSTFIAPSSASITLPDDFPAELCERIEQYRVRTRNSPEETDALILDICRGRWMTLPQLSEILDRNVAYIRNKSLQALVRHGKLQRKYESLTHKDQAYTTAK